MGNELIAGILVEAELEKALAELDKAYMQAMRGIDKPPMAIFNCAECHKSYVFTPNGDNQACEHLQALIGKLKS